MIPEKKLFIISHSHWDREWYRSTQGYRFLLIDMLDELLDTMSRDRGFNHFLLDGQTILLEDYLTLFPHRVSEARDLVASGRLGIGPWYVQPDEFLVSGEALMRNLMRGRAACRDLGGTCLVGWLPDTFGHIAQLPQILRNFDIDNFIFTRGLGDQPVRPAGYFWWHAPSGDRVLGVHQAGGYWNAGNLGFRSYWGRRNPDELDLALGETQVRDLLMRMDPEQTESILALWNGADHTPVQPSLPKVIRHLSRVLPGYQVRHGTATSLIRELWAISDDDWPRISGELRGSRYHPVLSGTLSSRMGLKQANQRVQRDLERYAEPLAAMAWLLGHEYPAAHLSEAWSTLLQNHCHDSICGCHIDAVTEQMQVRFSQAEEMAGIITQRALGRLGAEIGVPDHASRGRPLLVVNTLGEDRREVVRATLRLPSFEPPYHVLGPGGEIGPAQVLGHERTRYEWMTLETSVEGFLRQIDMWRAYLQEVEGLDIVSYRLEGEGSRLSLSLWLGDDPGRHETTFRCLLEEAAGWAPETRLGIQTGYHAVEVAFMARVPACGYSVYSVEHAGETAPVDPDETVQAADGQMVNRHLAVNVSPDGRLTIWHRPSGRVFKGLHVFEDCADAGDTYDYSPLAASPSGVRLSVPVQAEVLETGPVRGKLRLHSIYSIPASLTEDRRGRSGDSALLPVVTDLILCAGSPYLEIETFLVNQACDHRLRVLFPSDIQAEDVLAAGHFCAIARPLDLPQGVGWAQPPTSFQHHDGWFGAQDLSGGLIILSEGLPEHEAWQEGGGTMLALTLLRSVGWLSRGDLSTRPGHAGPAIETPDAQCLGKHRFRYGIMPLGEPDAILSARIGERFNAPLVPSPILPRSGCLPSQGSFISLSPESLAMSAVKRSEDGERLVVRFFNRSLKPVIGHVRTQVPMKGAWKAKACEDPVVPIHLTGDGHECEIPVGPAEIVTLLLEPWTR